jgi:glucuronokinase
MDANFDKRVEVSHVSDENKRMVAVARSCGASAKFTGSGGAIVGVCPDDDTFARLEAALGKLKVKVLRPHVAPAEP